MNLRNTKLRVKDEKQCIKLQKALFKKGHYWNGETSGEIKNEHAGHLYIEKDGCILYTSSGSGHYETDKAREIKASDILKDNKLEKAKKDMLK